VAEISYRQAKLDEAADILAVLIEVAPEIPVQTEPLEREEALYALIRNCETHRRRGIFTGLVERVLARLVPVVATVSPVNQSGAASLLERLGFRNIGSPGGEQRLRWDPGERQ
jgi:hypothetical protein